MEPRWSASSIGCVVLGTALAVSIGFHVRGARSPDAATKTAPKTEESVPAQATSDGAACQAELDRCRREALQASTFRALAAMPGAAAEPTPTRGAATPDAAPAKRESGTGLDAQQRALCKIAEGHVRALWALNKDTFLSTLTGVGTDAFARKWTDDAVNKLAGTLGLRADEKRRLEQGYSTIWNQHGATMQARLRAQPQDFAGLLEDVRAFWREEDELIARQIGDGARDDFRASELGARTAMAGILGTYAGKREYDESSAW